MIAALVGAGTGTLGLLTTGVYYQNCPLFGPVIGRGDRRARRLYLTFDDGPSESATPAILETLAAEQVPAGFFMVGDHVRRHPDLARRVADAGHEVGNHTFHHVKLHVHGPRRIQEELEQAHHLIAEKTGRAPRTFRAPHGFRNPFVTRVVRRFGYRVFGWTFGVWDTDKPGAEVIRRRVGRQIGPGAIILLHDGDGYDPHGDRSQTAEALPGLIRDARDAGYTFGSVAELLA